MKKSLALLIPLLAFISVTNPMYAQSVGISSTGSAPDTSAILDISCSNKGFLVPRVSLQSASDISTIPVPATSLLVYNTNAALGIGFYYNSGNGTSASWVKLNTEGTDWKISGNSGTNSATDFIGTTDAEALVLKTNDTSRITISETGNTVIGDATNNATIESDGSLTFYGNATTFDDMLFPFTKAENNNVVFDNTTVTLTLPPRDASKEIYIIAQFPHGWKEGSTVYPHIHWQQNFATPTPPNYINFVMMYKWVNIGDAVPGSWTTINTTDVGGNPYIKNYTSGTMHQISAWPGITATGKTISAIMLIKIYRYDANSNTNFNIPGYQFDIHYEKDAIGSHLQFTK